MRTILNKYFILVILFLMPVAMMAQPSWFYTNTGSNHTVLIQFPSAITIDGVAVSPNDYVGVFYDSLGTLACAGFVQVTSGTVALTAWGSQAGLHDGFQVNEAFQWKIWRTSDGAVFNASPSYGTVGFPNQGTFASNGMSSLISLVAVIGSDLSLGTLNSPTSGCGTLTNSETISIVVNNIGSTSVSSYTISYSWDNGVTYVIDTIQQILPANSTNIYSSTLTYDLSVQGNYDLLIVVGHPGDVDLSNNQFTTTIINGIPPTVDLSGLQTTHCAGSEATLIGLPAGGVFTSNIIAIYPGTNVAHFVYPGNHEVYYTYTDNAGCSTTDTATITVNPIPQIQLGNNLFHCDGDIVELSVPSGYALYTWSNGSGDSTTTVTTSGLYHVTVSNSFGCLATDSVTVTFNSTPTANIQGDTIACEGHTIALSVAGQGTSYLWSTNSFNDFINVTTSGLYSVTVSENGCLGYDEVNLYFNPSPVVDLGVDFSVCEGETVTLDAGVFSSYLWNDGSTSQTSIIDQAGQYFVTVTDNNTCEGTDNIIIGILPAPVADFSFSTNNSVVTFTNESFYEDANSWEWNFGDGSTSNEENPVHTYTEDGDFIVYLKVTNSCGSDSIQISINVVEIDMLTNDFNISVIPNPSNGKFNVDFINNKLEEVSITIYNNIGQEILTKTNSSYSKDIRFEFNFENNHKGIYFVRLTTNSNLYSKKIILK